MYKPKKFTMDDLKIFKSLSFDQKLRKTKNLITEYIDYFGEDNVYLSFSGGKDSTVLKHIIDNMGYDIESVYIDTGLEYPEIKQFVKGQSNIKIIYPELKFNQVIKQFGFPVWSKEVAKNIYYGRKAIKENNIEKINRYVYGIRKNKKGEIYKFYELPKKAKILLDSDIKISSYCCDIMKKNPVKKYEKETNKHPFIATLTSESKLRETSWLQNGCNAFDVDRPISTPLSIWSEQDILQYIYEYNVNICSVYGKVIFENGLYKLTGVQRTGCLFCMFGVHKEKTPNRFELLKQTYPELYDYCINKLECKKVLDIIDVTY